MRLQFQRERSLRAASTPSARAGGGGVEGRRRVSVRSGSIVKDARDTGMQNNVGKQCREGGGGEKGRYGFEETGKSSSSFLGADGHVTR